MSAQDVRPCIDAGEHQLAQRHTRAACPEDHSDPVKLARHQAPAMTYERLVDILEAHQLTDRSELGYTRRVCGTCGSTQTCSPVAQAREEAAELGIDLLKAADEARGRRHTCSARCDTAEPALPVHKRPSSCHVCGSATPHPAGDPARGGHTFWSNADAYAEALKQPVGYDPAAKYVDETRGR